MDSGGEPGECSQLLFHLELSCLFSREGKRLTQSNPVLSIQISSNSVPDGNSFWGTVAMTTALFSSSLAASEETLSLDSNTYWYCLCLMMNQSSKVSSLQNSKVQRNARLSGICIFPVR